MKFHYIIPALALSANFVSAQTATDSTAAVDSLSAPVAAVETEGTVPAPAAAVETPTAEAAADNQTVEAAAEKTTPDSIAENTVVENAATENAAEPTAVTAAAAPVTTATPVAAEQTTPKLLGGTELKGNLHGFLKADKSPYLVTENLVVDKASAVIVEPGVVLQFAPGTGLYVQGQFVVAGSNAEPVVFKPASTAPTGGSWKGIFISGENTSEIRNATVSGAENGIAVENSSLNLRFSFIENTSNRGVYAKNSKVEISDCQFTKNNGAALHVASYSEAKVERAKFSENTVALYSSKLASTSLGASSFENNTYGILDMGNSHLDLHNTPVQKNKVGASAAEVLDQSVLDNTFENATNFNNDAKTVASALPADPEIPGVESRPVDPSETIGNVIEARNKAASIVDTTQKSWTVSGNVMLGGNFHYVQTRKNHKHRDIIVGSDTISTGEHFKNVFQVPDFGAEASAYLLMTSPDGKTIEFNTDLTADSWNHFSPNPVTLSYSDNNNRLVLGDFQKTAGDIYMSGLPLFGAGYTLSLLKNNANQPLFTFDGFFGEARRSYTLDSRHPNIYNDYIDDGELQAQRIAYGGSFTWAPVRRFDATFGVIYADDEMEDPILRDGSKKGSTSDPLQTSLTMYADGNWLFYPGDIELKGMIAVGRADTADVAKERAINKVFTAAGVNASSIGTLRQLMNNESKISSLSYEELLNIFGDNTRLTRGQMRDSLRTLIRDAKLAKREEDSDIEDGRVLGLNWGSQNFAIGASLFWNIHKTTLSGHIKYVGEDFYSAGSPDQLADTREFGGRLEQIITNFWTLGFGYQLNVENAAIGGKTNLFGLNEGTRWGLFTSGTDDWFDEHELDNDRAKYIQNWNLDNTFKLTPKLTANVGYGLEYRTQYRPYQLHGDYILEDGIYRDEWFVARKGKPVFKIDEETSVDSARWVHYMSLSSEDYLASKFQERVFKNTWTAGLTLEAYKSVFKVSGRWTLRTDDSKFHKDSLIQDMDLADTTWAKLGYYFGGADYFEHSYPISVTTTLDRLQNHFEFTPRFKSYERDDMNESEITLFDEFEIPLISRFLTLGANGEFRYLNTSWSDGDEDIDETEMDVLFGLNLKVHHTKHLSSEWNTGAAMYYRPDNLSDEYKDIYFGVNVNYVF